MAKRPSFPLQDPFFASPGKPNKNGLTPLWIASWYNNTRVGTELLRAGADANRADPSNEVTPLHCAIYGYHIDRWGRVEKTSRSY